MSPPDAISAASAIERLPHVRQAICTTWGTQELDGYINHLLSDSRAGQRSGFPVDVTAELLFLAELNKLVRAVDVARRREIAFKDAYRQVDRQDRGIPADDPAEPPVARAGHAREEREPGAHARLDRPAEKAGGGFARFMRTAVIFTLLLFLAWQYVLPLFLRK